MGCYGKTDQGMQRDNNEDYFFFSDTQVGCLPNLYIVADGMGGHRAGEVASYTAVNEFVNFLQNSSYDVTESDILDILVDATKAANRRTYEYASSSPAYADMGTTLVACAFEGNKIYIVNVGDSRLYRYRDGTFTQLTTDHTYVAMLVKNGEITKEEAKVHPRKNVITRAIGTDPDVLCDGIFFDVAENDLYLLCSDGLTGMVEEEDIAAILEESTCIEEKINKLIELANNNGGADNITVVIADPSGRCG